MRFLFPKVDAPENPQKPCQARTGLPAHRNGFTLIEMITVIVIILILATAAGYAMKSAGRNARRLQCSNNLRQFAEAILVYRGEHNFQNPPWLSNLYPDYVDNKAMYLCKSDEKDGTDNARPDDLCGKWNLQDQWPEVNDHENNSRPGANDAVRQCSYFYEFSVAASSWKDEGWQKEGEFLRFSNLPDLNAWAWCDAKENQLRFGDKDNHYKPYSESRLPIVRCFHHWREMEVYTRPQNTDIEATNVELRDKVPMTLNVAYAGNVYIGPLTWELTPQPGDK